MDPELVEKLGESCQAAEEGGGPDDEGGAVVLSHFTW